MNPIEQLRRRSTVSIGRLRRRVAAIEAREADLMALDDDRLRKEALALRYRARSGEPLDDLVIPAFALVREASRRSLGLRHHDVQLIGGLAMHVGAVVEMQTGEGKTLTATLPTSLAALAGRGAHVATANDYLARRDAETTAPVYLTLGLTVGIVQGDSSPAQRRAAYACDVTYGTAKEFGFDFLRDRLKRRRADELGQGASDELSDRSSTIPRGFMLVDEADALMLDEARTPLIVSSVPETEEETWAELHRWAWRTALEFEEDRDFRWTDDHQAIRLTPRGRREVRRRPLPAPIADEPLIDLYGRIELALLVRLRYVRDRHYVVRGDEVVIVDEFTGRLAEGRRWRDGIHQVIEAREGTPISPETGQAARITLQNFLLRYERLAGMTGTVANSRAELRRIYRLETVKVPTHRPPRRELLTPRVYGTAREKWLALVDEAIEVHRTGRPVLIGTRTIDASQIVSALLRDAGVEHRVLNAHQVEVEAGIVATAGRRGAVTVATNMAGRGTDIRLEEASLQLGGLLVLGSEMHESQRIDRQLIGRCGRQGDPGAFRQYLSLEDELLRTGLGPIVAKRLAERGSRTVGAIDGAVRRFVRAQRRVEAKHYRQRLRLMEQELERQRLHQAMGQDPYLDSAG